MGQILHSAFVKKIVTQIVKTNGLSPPTPPFIVNTNLVVITV